LKSETATPLSNNLDIERLSIFSKGSISGIIVSVLCASALVFGFGLEFQQDITLKLSWYTCFLLAATLRVATTRYWMTASKERNFDPSKHKELAYIGIVSVATLWAIYPILIIPSLSDVVELACIVSIYTALSSGAASVLSAFKPIALIFITLLMLPLTISLVISPVENAYILGILALGFTVVILLSAMRSADFTNESIKMRHENLSLVTRLEEQNKQILSSKNVLEKRVLERTDKIFRLSNIDPLTNLFNRGAFSSQLDELIQTADARQTDVSLLFIDLDGFKTINDIHGHNIGDSVLKVVAKRLDVNRPNDSLLCRWGGDEFLVSCHSLEITEIQAFADTLISRLSEPMETKVGVLSVNATIGIALYPQHGSTESVLISNADIAMYHQKNIAKGKALMFTDEIQHAISRTSYLKDALTTAIENNEFSIVYQPVVSSKSDVLIFSEVLIRWKKQDEMISPTEFIEVAEQHGFIQEIGMWVVRQVAKELNQVNDLSLCVSINMSVVQLMTNGVADNVKAVFEQANIDTSRIYIEVTESILTNDAELLKNNINRFNELGFSIAIDDFGTGYSSLSQLQQLAPNVIKIDKSFVDNWEQGGEVIVQAVQDMSAKLSFDVVIEGVETKEQSEKVQTAGVQFIQGFYYAKPMPLAALRKWIQCV